MYSNAALTSIVHAGSPGGILTIKYWDFYMILVQYIDCTITWNLRICIGFLEFRKLGFGI